MSLKVGELYAELRLDRSQFTQGLHGAQRDFRNSGGSFIGQAARVGSAIVAGLAVKNIVREIGQIGMSYEQTRNVFEAVTGANTEQMKKVSETATALGDDLQLPGVSASGAMTAMLELAKAGLSVDDAMAAARGTLQLAIAANISEGEAATYTAAALNTFKLSGDQASRVADMLAATANASAGEIGDMGDAVQQSGSVFAAAGVPLSDLLTMIGELANNGIKGSDAGTSLKTALLSLQTPSAEQAKIMQRLGLSLYDSTGKMKPMRQFIGELSTAMGRQTQEGRDWAIGMLFGSDAARAANILIKEGTAGFDKMSKAVNTAGAAQKVAEARAKGVSGALEGLKSQLQTIGQRIFDHFAAPIEGALRKVSEAIQTVTDGIKKGRDPLAILAGVMSDLGVPSEIIAWVFRRLVPLIKAVADAAPKIGTAFEQKVLPAFMALAPLLDGILAALPGIITFLGDHADTIAGLFLPIATFAGAIVAAIEVVKALTAAQVILNIVMDANPIGLIIVAIGAFVGAFIWAYQNVDWFREAIDRAWDRLVRLWNWLNSSGIIDKLGKMFSLTGAGWVVNQLTGGGKATGGSVFGGSGGFMVGEHGPEWFQPQQSGSILNSRETRALLAAAGGDTYNETINVTAQSNANADAIARAIAWRTRRRRLGR